MEILTGHTSPETALIIEDYPYGFRLRCKIRYWLEFKRGKGYRLITQTTNPKKEEKVWNTREVWNTPKASTYQKFGGVMLKNEDNDHITWRGLSEYNSTAECEEFLAEYGHTLPEEGFTLLTRWINQKKAYDLAKAEGHTIHVAAVIAAQTE